MDALAYIEKPAKAKPAPLIAITGDEDFLRRQARTKLVADLLGDADPAFALTTFEGDEAEWSKVKSELDTLPFLSPRRVVVIEKADPFVTKYRAQLEQYAASASSAGVLVLEVKTWPANTRLAKATPDAATLVAKSPNASRILTWCRAWAKQHYECELVGDAAEWLLELVGPSMGLLDQELAKLAVFADDKRITRERVDQLVGRTRQAETFKIFDAIGAARSGDAIKILQRLFAQGEEPLAVLGAFSWQLRRLAAVSRCVRRGMPVGVAMDRCSVPPFARGGLEQQLRHLGKQRMDRVYDWLVETDLAMKGSSPLPPKLIMERLVVKLAQPAEKLSA